MANYTYYCKVTKKRDNINPGVYTYCLSDNVDKFTTLLTRLHSETVWRQGPRGGIKIIKDKHNGCDLYITQNENEMKKFMWVKLQAESIKKGA